MKTFAYTAYTQEGRAKRGIVVADDANDASARVTALGLLPGEINEQRATKSTVAGTPAAKGWRRSALGRDLLSVFTRQMAVLLSAGLTAEAALEAVQDASPNRQIQNLAAEARAGLLEGAPLSQALGRSGRDLPAFYTAAVQAGENSGELDAVFETLAEYLETAQGDRASLASALLYPAFVTLMAIAVCGVLMVTVAPEIVAMFESAGRPLPPLTVTVLGIVDFIRTQWEGLALGVVAFLVFLTAVARIPSWRRRRDRLFLRLPLIGRFMRLGASAQYLRTLALVIRSRLPLTEALRHASAVLDVADHRDQAVEAGDALSRGESLSQALTRLEYLHPVARQLMQVGEESARLAPMSERAATLAETWLKTEKKRGIVLLEPLSMIVVGVMVLAIVLSILLPIFDLQSMVGNP